MKFHLATQVKLKLRPSALHKAWTSPPWSELSSQKKTHVQIPSLEWVKWNFAFMNTMQQLRIHSLTWAYYQIAYPTSRMMSSQPWLFQRKENNRLSGPMQVYCFCQERSFSSVFSVLSPEAAKVWERPLRACQNKAITFYLTILGVSKVNEC